MPRKKKKAKTKAVGFPKQISNTKLSSQMIYRFAQNYVACCDPTRAAVSAGIGVDGSHIDYEEAEFVGKKLIQQKATQAHIGYLNNKYHPDLKLDFQRFLDLVAEMVYVTFADYFYNVNDEDILKPVYMLTKAEQMCLVSVDQYHRQQNSDDGDSKSTSILKFKLLDKTKVMEMYARVAGFYTKEEGLSEEEAMRKLRDAMSSMEQADGVEG